MNRSTRFVHVFSTLQLTCEQQAMVRSESNRGVVKEMFTTWHKENLAIPSTANQQETTAL